MGMVALALATTARAGETPATLALAPPTAGLSATDPGFLEGAAVWMQAPEASSAPISTGRAVLYSLLLPGLGDYKLGHKQRAVVFFGIEAAIWTTFVVSRIEGAAREEDYEEFAVRFAGVERMNHSDDFYAIIRDYDSWEEYAADVKMEGRYELYPDVGSEALERYFAQNRVTDYEPWLWQSLDKKVEFQVLRSSSKTAYRRATFALAAAAANRVVSAIFTYATIKLSGPDEQAARRYRLDFMPPRADYAAAVTLIHEF